MPTVFDIIAGHRLREVRERRRLSRAELAGRLDAPVRLVINLETGAASITARRRLALAQALRVRPQALLLVVGSPL